MNEEKKREKNPFVMIATDSKVIWIWIEYSLLLPRPPQWDLGPCQYLFGDNSALNQLNQLATVINSGIAQQSLWRDDESYETEYRAEFLPQRIQRIQSVRIKIQAINY